MADDNFIVFNISGGAGKNVLATAVVKAIKKANPTFNIVVLTAYTEVWMFNPNVYRCYHFSNTPFFYENYIYKKKVKVYAIDPYNTNDYIQKSKSLIEIWCDLVGVPFGNEKPELFFNQREIEYVKNKFIGNTKILAIQTNGGMQQDVKISWMRDLPLDTAQEVVNHFVNDYRIIHIRRDDQPQLYNVEQFRGNLRELFLLIRFSEKRLLIDSISQHVAAALGKESTVVWVRNNPEVLGYAMHDNIVTEATDDLNVFANSYLEPYEITGNIYQCPFKEGTKLFNSEQLIESIKKQINKKEVKEEKEKE